MHQTFEYDAAQVLEVARHASLEEIREAYRSKTKKHHPDHGGDSWAFRLVTQAYEALGQSRVANYLRDLDEPEAGSASAPRHAARPDAAEAPIRRGLRDALAFPGLLVDVESLILRLELENPYEVLTSSNVERNLSCSLNLSWPSTLVSGQVSNETGGATPEEVLTRLSEAFDEAMRQVEPTASWSQSEGGRFGGLLAFNSARTTSEAFMILRAELRRRGLGANQWTREIVIPRDREAGQSADS